MLVLVSRSTPMLSGTSVWCEKLDWLSPPILKNTKVVFLQFGNQPSAAIADRERDRDEIDIGSNGLRRTTGRLLRKQIRVCKESNARNQRDRQGGSKHGTPHHRVSSFGRAATSNVKMAGTSIRIESY